MFKFFFSLVLSLSLAPIAAAQDQAPYPKPSAFPISWELKFTHSDPKRILVTLPGESTPTAYWYITYSVTNPGDPTAADPDAQRERIFYPAFTMRTKDGKIITGNDGVHPDVFAAIKDAERNKYLQDPVLIGGRILLGEDQTQESVAIWPETSARMGLFTIFASGMWGETAPAADAAGNPLKNAQGDPILLHKTLMMVYHVDGDQTHFGPVRKVSETFVMR